MNILTALPGTTGLPLTLVLLPSGPKLPSSLPRFGGLNVDAQSGPPYAAISPPIDSYVLKNSIK